jgi:hypothetical protein
MDKPPLDLVRRRGKWEARLSVDNSRVLYVGRYRTSWDAERALQQATDTLSAKPKLARHPTTPDPLPSAAMVHSGHARPSSSRSDVERTAPHWLVAPTHHRRRSSLILRHSVFRRGVVVHVFDFASRELMLVARMMGPQRFALYEPALKPGKPIRTYSIACDLAPLDEGDFSSQRKVSIVTQEGGGFRQHVLQRLLKSRQGSSGKPWAQAATPRGSRDGAGAGKDGEDGDTGTDEVIAWTPRGGHEHSGVVDGGPSGKWVPILAWGYGFGASASPFPSSPGVTSAASSPAGVQPVGLLSVSVPHVSHSGVPRVRSKRPPVDCVEVTADRLALPCVRLSRSVLSLMSPSSSSRGDSSSFVFSPASPFGLPGVIGDDDTSCMSSSFLEESCDSEMLRDLDDSGLMFELANVVASAPDVCDCELDAGGSTPVAARHRRESATPVQQLHDYRVDFKSPLCALQAGGLAIAHLMHCGFLQPPPGDHLLPPPPSADNEPAASRPPDNLSELS